MDTQAARYIRAASYVAQEVVTPLYLPDLFIIHPGHAHHAIGNLQFFEYWIPVSGASLLLPCSECVICFLFFIFYLFQQGDTLGYGAAVVLGTTINGLLTRRTSLTQNDPSEILINTVSEASRVRLPLLSPLLPDVRSGYAPGNLEGRWEGAFFVSDIAHYFPPQPRNICLICVVRVY